MTEETGMLQFDGAGKGTPTKRNDETSNTPTTPKSSIVSQKRSSLDKKSASPGVVLDLHDFYKSQKAKKMGDHQKKEQAAQELHSFRITSPDKLLSTPKKTESLSASSPLNTQQAADRAAAAAYLGQQMNASYSSVSSFEMNQAADRAATALSQNNTQARAGTTPPQSRSRSRHVQFTSSAIARKEVHTNSSGVAAIRATLEDKARQHGGSTIVVDLDEFYKHQKFNGLQEKRQRSEATQLLHNYQMLVEMGSTVNVKDFCREQRALKVVDSLDEDVANQILVEYQAQIDNAVPQDVSESPSKKSDIPLNISEKPGIDNTAPQDYPSEKSDIPLNISEKPGIDNAAPQDDPSEKSDIPLNISEKPGIDDAVSQDDPETSSLEKADPHDVSEKPSIENVIPQDLSEKPSLVDYADTDYRGFIFVVHSVHGLLLLHCTRKIKKGPHYQLPGGHIDEPEFVQAAQNGGAAKDQLLFASKMGAARELYEETGIDVRHDLSRLEPAALRSTSDAKDANLLTCQLGCKLYFLLNVADDDFATGESSNVVACQTKGVDLKLRLSHEHSGFAFARDPEVAAQMIQKHSGGSGSEALLMSMNRSSGAKQKKKESKRKPNAKAVATESTADDCDKKNRDLYVADDAEDLLPPPKRKGLFNCFFCM